MDHPRLTHLCCNRDIVLSILAVILLETVELTNFPRDKPGTPSNLRYVDTWDSLVT